MKSRLPSFFPALIDTKLVDTLASADSLMKLSRPLLSIIAGYDANDRTYDETLDLSLLARAEKPSHGYNDILLFLFAIKNGCIKTVEDLLKAKYSFLSTDRVLTIDFALSPRFHSGSAECKMPNEHHETTPLIHAIRHRQFGIAAMLINDCKEEVKKTINRRFRTKQVLLCNGSIGQPWVSFGTALSYAIEACHLPTIISLRDLGAEVAPDYCLDSLKRFLEAPEYASMSDKDKRPFITMLMNHGNIKIDDKNLSIDHVSRLCEILDPKLVRPKVVGKRR